MSQSEEPLPDDYPVYEGYWYVLDGQPRQSLIDGTVSDLKRLHSVSEVKSCDVLGRGLELL